MVRLLGVAALGWGAAVLAAAPAPKPTPAPKEASGEATKDAKRAFEAGQKAYKAKKYAEAIESFETAYRLRPHPIVRYNIARCYEQLGDAPKALTAFRTFLLEVPDTTERENVAKAIVGLERKLATQGKQQLMVVADPRDAVVSVDGARLGPSPAFIELGPGDHRVLVERDGLETISRSFVMSTSRSMELSFVLQPPAPVTPPVVSPRPSEPPLTPPPPPASVVLDRPSYPLRAKLWAPLTVTAVGAVAAGVGFGLMASMGQQLELELSTQKMVTARAEELANGASTMQLVGWIGAGVAAAGAIATIIFFVVPGERVVTPTVSVGPGGATFGFVGAFP